jgi:p-aminobenzoyl-glutamate transporter AbgT
MIDSILDAIIARFTSFTDFIFDPLWTWYFWGAVLVVVVLVISWFVPFKWVRAALGAFLLLVGAFIAGGRMMHGEMKSKLDEIKERERALKAQQKKEKGGWNW